MTINEHGEKVYTQEEAYVLRQSKIIRKFEYHCVEQEDYKEMEDVKKVLDYLGADGWELVQVIYDYKNGAWATYYFKREIL